MPHCRSVASRVLFTRAFRGYDSRITAGNFVDAVKKYRAPRGFQMNFAHAKCLSRNVELQILWLAGFNVFDKFFQPKCINVVTATKWYCWTTMDLFSRRKNSKLNMLPSAGLNEMSEMTTWELNLYTRSRRSSIGRTGNTGRVTKDILMKKLLIYYGHLVENSD